MGEFCLCGATYSTYLFTLQHIEIVHSPTSPLPSPALPCPALPSPPLDISIVTVSCDGPHGTHSSGGNYYNWTVQFDTNAGNLPSLTADIHNIKPAGSSFTVTDIQDGTSVVLGGSFTVEFDGQRTGYLPFTLGAAGMKSALEGESG